MIGDRVRIGATGTFKEADDTMVFVYRPKVDAAGNFIEAGDGTYMFESVGGVKAGTSGAIQGQPVKVHRTQLKTYSGMAGLGSTDNVLMFPVFLDHYQQVGWFQNDDVKIMAGGRA